ncbi:hypothetical protein [Nocardia miyunensis]|uniref:hypothetical protein n=1 Tax=Nocardia miyunensis TaxID=282684 RepID=UPI00082FB0B7|nr:hypothetical protein [Nocardia miyunensis]
MSGSGVVSAKYDLVNQASIHTTHIAGGMNQTNGDLGKMWTALVQGFQGQGSEAASQILSELKKRLDAYENDLAALNKTVVSAVDYIQHTDHAVSAGFLSHI